MQHEHKYNRYVKPKTGYFEKNATVEAPRLLEYLSSTLGVLERLKNGDLENDSDEKRTQQQRDEECDKLVSAIAAEVTGSGKDLHSLCCHPEASMLLEAFLDWTQLTHLTALAHAFGQVKPGFGPWLLATISDARGSFAFDHLLRRVITLYTQVQLQPTKGQAGVQECVSLLVRLTNIVLTFEPHELLKCLDGPAATSALRNLIRVLAGLDISNSRITDKGNEQVRLGGLRHPHLAGKATEFIDSFLRKMSTVPDRMTQQATTLLDLAHRPHGSLLIQEFFVVALALQSQDLLDSLLGSILSIAPAIKSHGLLVALIAPTSNTQATPKPTPQTNNNNSRPQSSKSNNLPLPVNPAPTFPFATNLLKAMKHESASRVIERMLEVTAKMQPQVPARLYLGAIKGSLGQLGKHPVGNLTAQHLLKCLPIDEDITTLQSALEELVPNLAEYFYGKSGLVLTICSVAHRVPDSYKESLQVAIWQQLLVAFNYEAIREQEKQQVQQPVDNKKDQKEKRKSKTKAELMEVETNESEQKEDPAIGLVRAKLVGRLLRRPNEQKKTKGGNLYKVKGSWADTVTSLEGPVSYHGCRILFELLHFKKSISVQVESSFCEQSYEQLFDLFTSQYGSYLAEDLFRINNSKKVKRLSLKLYPKLQTHFVAFAQNTLGSNTVLAYFDFCDLKRKRQIVQELVPHVASLKQTVHGNKVLQLCKVEVFITNKKAWQQHCEKKIEKSKKLREIAQLAAPKEKEAVATRVTGMPTRPKSEPATTTNSLTVSKINSPSSLNLIASKDSIGLPILDSSAEKQKKSKKKDKKEIKDKSKKSKRTDGDTSEKKRKRSDSIESSVVEEKAKRKKEKLDRS